MRACGTLPNRKSRLVKHKLPRWEIDDWAGCASTAKVRHFRSTKSVQKIKPLFLNVPKTFQKAGHSLARLPRLIEFFQGFFVTEGKNLTTGRPDIETHRVETCRNNVSTRKPQTSHWRKVADCQINHSSHDEKKRQQGSKQRKHAATASAPKTPTVQKYDWNMYPEVCPHRWEEFLKNGQEIREKERRTNRENQKDRSGLAMMCDGKSMWIWLTSRIKDHAGLMRQKLLCVFVNVERCRSSAD